MGCSTLKPLHALEARDRVGGHVVAAVADATGRRPTGTGRSRGSRTWACSDVVGRAVGVALVPDALPALPRCRAACSVVHCLPVCSFAGSWRPGRSPRAARLRSHRGVPRSPGFPARAASIPGGDAARTAAAERPGRADGRSARAVEPCCEREARWYTSTVAGPAGRRTHRWGYSSAGRASGWQPEGQRFEPAYLHQVPPR